MQSPSIVRLKENMEQVKQYLFAVWHADVLNRERVHVLFVYESNKNVNIFIENIIP